MIALPFKLQKSIILASGSPRRKQLLADLGFTFEVVLRPVDESWPEEMPALEVAKFLAAKKAAAYHDLPNYIIITADTTVCLGNEVLNKAATEAEALEMLRKLQGQTHQVVTGIAVRSGDKTYTHADVVDVTMAPMTDEELLAYIHHAKPFDKAGAYGIQEWIGMAGIIEIKGSYYTVMGLPTHWLYQTLKQLGA